MTIEESSTKYASYNSDESGIKGNFCEIAFPESEEEVQNVINSSFRESKKIIFQGARTGLCGGAVPNGERVVNLTKLNNISDLNITGEDAEITAECGATLTDISKVVESKGFRFPINPTEDTATVGGMFSTNASGPNSLYFKRFSDCVKSINFTALNSENYIITRGEYVEKNGNLPLPYGNKIEFKGLKENMPLDFYKNGIDLIDFLAGKEGVLGAVTKLTFDLIKEPEDIWGVVFFLKDCENALAFSDKLKSYNNKNVNLTTAEYFSQNTLKLIKNNLENPLLTKLPEFPGDSKSAIYVEIESEDEDYSTDALMELLELFAEVGGDEDDTWAQNGKEQIKPFRNMRHAVVSLLNENTKIHSVEKGFRYETDFYVPQSDFKDYLSLYNDALKENDLSGAIYGNILKNHLHLAFLSETKEEQEKAEKVIFDLSKKVGADNGKISYKYGVGKAKKALIKALLNKEEIDEIIKIVKVFNPNF